MKRIIDHIVYCVLDLERAIDNIEKLLGVRPVIGGRHLEKGTKNALLNLGGKCYLEILAVDHDNTNFDGSRWMGIDLIENPRITRWSLKSDQLQKDSEILAGYSPTLGVIDGGSRQTSTGNMLTWQMILPISTPEIEVIPFMTDWSQSDSHPTDTLEQKCRLEGFDLFHPEPFKVQSTIDELGLEMQVMRDDNPRIQIGIDSPNGMKVLF